MAKLFIKYLSMFGYDVNNKKGNSCPVLNTMDMTFLLGYVIIVIINLWSKGTSETPISGDSSEIINLTYIATAILCLRSTFKFWIKEKTIKKSTQGAVTIAYTIGVSIFFIFTAIFVVCYFLIPSEQISRVFLTLYYILFTAFELTEILTRFFDAVPHKYQG